MGVQCNWMVWSDIGITLALSGKDFVLDGKEDMNANKKVWNIRSYPHLGRLHL